MWFTYGHSDSDTTVGGIEACSIVDGLGFVQLFHCPHYDKNNRADDFNEKILVTGDVGLAMDDNCAIEIEDDRYRIVKGDEHARAFKLYVNKGEVVKEELECSRSFKALKTLLN